MKITNNSGKLITLLNGRKIKKYSTIEVTEVSSGLQEQIENLSNMGLITVEN